MFKFLQRRSYPDWLEQYRAGPWPAPQVPWRDARYAVLDVETSGLDARHDALLAIGLVEIEAGRVQLERAWYSLVRPPDGFLVGEQSIRIHHLTRAELAAAPPPTDVLPLLLERLRERVLVVHVAQIDVRFLNRALHTHYGSKLYGPTLDTARLAMTLHHHAQLLGEARPDMPAPAIQLRTLAERFGLPVYAQHNALSDAITTAQLFLAQASRLARQGQATLGGLLRAGKV
jgi:DNA polymerase-3 subunit epsilon